MNYLQRYIDDDPAGPLNPIDLLVMSEVVHAPFEAMGGACVGKTLGEMADSLYPGSLPSLENTLQGQRQKMWEAIRKSKRFSEVLLIRFDSRFIPEDEMQFAGGCFAFGDIGIVAFRGTDATLVGWKEDFNLCLEKPVPSQLAAACFLTEVLDKYRFFSRIEVCGHSKGGNLAMFSACMPEERYLDRINGITAFDAPGMSHYVLNSAGWKKQQSKIVSYIPESSVIGLLMGHNENKTIIDSETIGIMQHNPFTWKIENDHFVTVGDTTFYSRFVNGTLSEFLNGCTIEQRRVLIDCIFRILDVIEVTSIRAIPMNLLTHLPETAEEIRQFTPENKAILSRLMHLLLESGGTNAANLLLSTAFSILGI